MEASRRLSALTRSLACMVCIAGLSAGAKHAGPPVGAQFPTPFGPEYPPPSGYGGAAPPSYHAPYVDAGYRYANEGYGAPLAINTPFDAPAGFDEMQGSESYVEPAKWTKLPKMIQKAMKNAQDQQRARLQSVKEILQQAAGMKNELKLLIKEQKSKKNAPPPTPEPYPPPPPSYGPLPVPPLPAYASSGFNPAPGY